jgi:hypothetical protein
MKDWLELKPYNKPTATDSYYVSLSNKVKDAIIYNPHFLTFRNYIDYELLNNLSCFLTSYFEDLISETNLWNTFIKCHKALYNKPLPFYDIDEYFDEEINEPDIEFLIWYYLNTYQDEQIIHPINDFIASTANEILAVFEEAWEYAPPNEHLKEFYFLSHDQEDYYKVRKVIDNILYKTYLFHTDTAFELHETELEYLSKDEITSHDISLLNENRDNLLHNQRTALLAMSGAQWLANMLGVNHPLYPNLLSLSPRVYGYFFYKGQNDEFINLEHVATGKKFNLDQRSFDHTDLLNEIDEIFYLGMVKWDGNWWFSGNLMPIGFNADLVLDEKNSMKSRGIVSFLDHEQMDMEEVMQKHYDMFLAYTDGNEVIFTEEAKIQEFVEGFMDYSQEFLELTDKQAEDSKQRARKEGLIGTDNDWPILNSETDLAQIYFNRKSGLEIAVNLQNAFPLPNNPNFNIDESEEDVLQVLTSNSISKELAEYCVEIGKDQIPFFKTDTAKVYLDDLDFILRFWKKQAYYSIPQVSFTGLNDK